MSHEGHYFKCGNCGYVGEEKELPQTKEHECGADKCPECKSVNYITCCFDSTENAEIGHHINDKDCECIKCNPEKEE